MLWVNMSHRIFNNLEETESFATSFVASILPTVKSEGLIVGLEGGLGAGKTTFVSAMMKVLNPQEKVSSPTYILEHQYSSDCGVFIRHWDLYRIPSAATPEELLEAVLPSELRLIEWASRSKEVSAHLDVILKFDMISETSRSCEVKMDPKFLVNS